MLRDKSACFNNISVANKRLEMDDGPVWCGDAKLAVILRAAGARRRLEFLLRHILNPFSLQGPGHSIISYKKGKGGVM